MDIVRLPLAETRNSPGRNAHCARKPTRVLLPRKGGSTREAKRICSTCEVRRECLEFLENDEAIRHLGRAVRNGSAVASSAPPADPPPVALPHFPFPRP